MSSFVDRAGKAFVDSVLIKERNTLERFSILDAWERLASRAAAYPQIMGCVMDIAREGDHYLIRLVMFDDQSQPIRLKGDMVVAYRLIAYNLASDVYAYTQGKKRCWLHVSRLLAPEGGTSEEDVEE